MTDADPTERPCCLAADILENLPGVGHGFFTRAGGVSEGLYASLNVGFGSDDLPENVSENRRRAMTVLGLPAEALNTVYQEHGCTVARAGERWPHESAPRADAMVTNRPGIALGILTADCAPVLFAEPEKGVIGAAHAGWRGALAGVLRATIEEMEVLGARRGAIRAAIGPTIAQRSYEVGPEFPAPFMAEDSENARFFHVARRAGHHMFDLSGYVALRLKKLGIGMVARLSHDTCSEADCFFSYRRARLHGELDYGRGLSAIVLTDEPGRCRI